MNNTTVIITVDGVEYTLDAANMTGRETGILKRVGHIKGVIEIPAALDGGDLEVAAALAGIAMQRAGITPDYEKLLDLPCGMIKIELPEANPMPAAEEEAKEAPAANGTQS